VTLNTSGKALPPPPDGQGDGSGEVGQETPPAPPPTPDQPQTEEPGADFLTDEGTAY